MISDLVELLAFACLVAGVFVLAGLGWAAVVACPCLLVIGAGLDDDAIARTAARAVAGSRRAASSRWEARRRARVKAA